MEKEKERLTPKQERGKRKHELDNKINALLMKYPAAKESTKLLKMYRRAIKRCGEDYCLEKVKLKTDREFLKGFAPIKDVCLEIQELKQKRHDLLNQYIPPAPTGNKEIDAISEKIGALMVANPKMSFWPKYKKRYEKLCQEHGDGYCLEKAENEQDKEFLEWFEPLRKVRAEIKELKERREALSPAEDKEKPKGKALSAKDKPPQRPPAPPPTGDKVIDGISEKIAGLIMANPKMSGWPKHKKRYEKLCQEHGDGYCLEKAKSKQDKDFLKWFEPLKLVRLEIKALKETRSNLMIKRKELEDMASPPVGVKLSQDQVQRVRLTRRPPQKKIVHGGDQSLFPKKGISHESNQSPSGIKYNQSKAYTAGFFKQERQSGAWLKKR